MSTSGNSLSLQRDVSLTLNDLPFHRRIKGGFSCIAKPKAYLAAERVDQGAPGRRCIDAPGLEVEQLILLQVTDGRAVGALDVISDDLNKGRSKLL